MTPEERERAYGKAGADGAALDQPLVRAKGNEAGAINSPRKKPTVEKTKSRRIARRLLSERFTPIF